MTVSYTGDVANASAFGCFWKILIRWKGSVYKLIWRELVVYLLMYFGLNLIYRHGLDANQRQIFEKVKVYCSKQSESIPMSFVLGFYVTLIVKRWWDQYWLLPLPDSLALYISSSLHGQDERGRLLRRTIMRYVMLSYIISLQRISFRVKKRFPSLQHLVDTGLMMESEKKIFDIFNAKTTVSKFWMPIVWASNLVNRAREEDRIPSDMMLQTILTELSEFRRKLGRVSIYDTVSVPLVYTQVVTLAVYTYFLAALIGRQWIHPMNPTTQSLIYPGYEIDLYFPIFLALQFIFYIGWLKVAETLINPFGEDDDDFELNWLIDRHIQVSYLVVDEIHQNHPEPLKDQYWEQVVPKELPYNLASERFRKKEPQGSTASMKIKLSDSVYDNLANVKRQSMVPDEVYADYDFMCIGGVENGQDSPFVDNRKNWLQRQLSRVESFRSTSSSSSLFNRNRASVGHNGGLPHMQMHNTGGHGHRLSLYDKLMNRRTSKDQMARNSLKIPQNIQPRNISPGVISGKENLANLIPHLHARPRVPTPDVSKESQLNILASSEKGTSPRTYVTHHNNNNNSNNVNRVHSPLTISLSNGSTGNSPIPPIHQNDRTMQVPLREPNNLEPLPPHGRDEIPLRNSNSGHHHNIPHHHVTFSSNTYKSGSGLYDLSPGTESPQHLILSPIEENDGSPYSTSSTSRSSKNSTNYPSTMSIFGRKPSPPPHEVTPSTRPPEPLPPLPPTPDYPISQRSHSPPPGLTINKINYEEESRILGSAGHHEGGSQIDSQDEEEPYMTIAEVNESRNTSNGMVKRGDEFTRNLKVIKPKSRPPPTRLQKQSNLSGEPDSSSLDVRKGSLPLQPLQEHPSESGRSESESSTTDESQLSTEDNRSPGDQSEAGSLEVLTSTLEQRAPVLFLSDESSGYVVPGEPLKNNNEVPGPASSKKVSKDCEVFV